MDQEPHAQEDHGVVVPRRRRERAAAAAGGGSVLLLVGLVMAAVAIVSVVLVTMKDKTIYSKPVDVLLQEKGKFANRPVRVEGNLVHGSLVHHDKPCEYDFTIEKNGKSLPVKYADCVVPDTFRDVQGMDVGVTVEGELHADNTFEATSVLAKCPSKYEMKKRAAQGEKMPTGDIPPY
ncbi:MAG TPA: cytochrome c maturation protein CcmE [Polyangiaceae bacterium]|jgi:cytochrome c-type biogenesis protein CcmE